FTGCDLDYVYASLRERWPEMDFTDCYMNPIMRESGLTPDQLMRARLYDLLKPRPMDPNAVAIIGNDLPTDPDSDLLQMLRGRKVHEITSCKTYAEYQEMAESAYYISYYPAARAGGDLLEQRLGGRHFYLPFSFDYDEIEAGLSGLAMLLDLPAPDFAGKREACDQALNEALAIIGERPIAIDYTYCPRPLGLALLLLDAGFRVERVYLDAVTPEEKPVFETLKANYPMLALYPTVHPAMRFHSAEEQTDFLAIGQKAAHFTNTDHFVNVVEGGGMIGFQAVTKTLEYLTDAHLHAKDMKSLVQMKGLGCACCL
ncbi:MAG: nitrogenase, partial [Oscillospiraceae bacterium]|nr:nitrogenase [Oscillospiraceae bacterium]